MTARAGSTADPLSALLGESSAIVAVRRSVAQFLARQSSARRPPPVLIQGETGTGKGLLAQAIHRAGPRASARLVDINCAAIPETLLESEVFGYERGAFTDARQAKPGLLQVAHRGTIFLDEIGLLPESLQSKLLKALEEQVVRRLGSTRDEPVDVWILAATSEDLLTRGRERRFRSDLYHRLAVFTISLPPLRARGQDAVLLAEGFLARACADYGLPPKQLSADARAALLAYPWPGNVRELSNVIERASVLSEAPLVTREMLVLPTTAIAGTAEVPPRGGTDALDDVMRAHMLGVLTSTSWNLSHAAALLKMSRNTLSARIERYGLRAGVPPRAARQPAPRPAPPPVSESSRAPEPAPPAAPVHWERRRVAVLKAALAGEGERAPEPRALQAAAGKLEAFGGRLLGRSPSTIAAVFGSEPVEDAPLRAAHAAVAIQKSVMREAGRDERPCAVRIGIHVGQALVGTGSGAPELDMETEQALRAALGALVDVAESDTIVVSEAARPLLERRFALEPLGRDAAGLGPVYRLGVRTATAFQPGGGAATFVGRIHEMKLLQSRLALAREGHGQVVGIVGEAGMGKSRLLHELHQGLRGEPLTILEGHCLSYGVGVPFLPIVEILSAAWGLTEGDNPEATAVKVHRGLEGLGLDASAAAPYALQLLGIREGTEGLAELTPEAINRRSLDLLRAICLESSRQCPLVLALEDVHWIDTSAAAFLSSLLESLPGAPILLVLTYRPGYRSSALETSYATQIALPPLSDEESLSVARAVIGTERVPAGFADVILQKAEGNPFLIEELARAMAGRTGGGALPGAIEAVLAARIDQLPERTRQLLRVAAVLGRRVPSRLLGALWDDPGDLEPHLRHAAQREFLYAERAGEDAVYVFKHTLTQEVAYGGLSVTDREALHLRAGRALERLHAGRLHEVYDRLAHHFSRTGEAGTAIDYLVRLADKAAALYANAEAVAALEEALRQVERLGGAAERRRLEIVLRLAHALHFVGRMPERLELLLRHQPSFEQAGDPVLIGRHQLLLGVTYSLLGDRAGASRSGQRALEEATRGHDEATVGKAHYMLAHEAYWAGRLEEGVQHGREAVARLRDQKEPWWLGMAHWILGVIHGFMGEFDAALKTEEQARAIGERIGDPRLLSYAAWTIGGAFAVRGDHAAGIEACRLGVEQAPDPVSRANALGFLGECLLESGDAASAVPLLEESIDLFAQFRIRELEGWFSASLGEALLARGEIAKAEELAARGLELGRSSAYWVAIGYGQRALGRIAHARQAWPEAERHLLDACETFRAHRAPHELGRTLLVLARVARALDHQDAAGKCLQEAQSLFQTLRVPEYLARTSALAAELAVPLKEVTSP